MQSLQESLAGMRWCEALLVDDPKRSEIPVVHLKLDEAGIGKTAMQVVCELQEGAPAIHANPSHVRDGIVAFGTALPEGGGSGPDRPAAGPDHRLAVSTAEGRSQG